MTKSQITNHKSQLVIGSLVIGHSPPAISLRAVLLGLALLPLNALWQTEIEFVRYSDSPTIPALFFHTLSMLMLLMLLNAALLRLAPRLALSRGELLTIYVILCIGAELCGHDWMQILFSSIVYIVRFASPTNNWQELIHPHLPGWLIVSDKDVVRALAEGDSTFYKTLHIQAWLPVALIWSGFVILVALFMLCLMALLRKQWDNERLNYPIAEVPLRITEPDGVFFRNRLMWLGFAIGAMVQVVNLLNLFYPSIPRIQEQPRYFPFFSENRPWSAAGPFPVSYFPFSFGLCFLMPTELQFSCWFFFLFNRAQSVLADAFGIYRAGGFPYMLQQCAGGYLGLAVVSLWAARGHFKKVVRWLGGCVDDREEPMPYRWACLGVLVFGCLVIGFAMAAGMSWWAVPYFLLFFGIVLGVTRIRAEMGLPTNELFRVGADDMLTRMRGTKLFSPKDLTLFSLFSWMMRTHRQFPMQVQADMLRIGHRAKIPLRKLTIAIFIATILGTLVAFWAYLHVGYRIGMQTAKWTGPGLVWSFGPEPWNRLDGWLRSPTAPDYRPAIAYAFGLSFTLFLVAMRHRFLWFPFHPAGYVVMGSFGLPRHWVPIFSTWLIKTALLRYGGYSAYQKALPFFLGLVAGEFLAGFIRTLLALIFGWTLPRQSGIGGL